ncbi:unnamed protein product, partial [Protopolystoma xenopodis]
MSEDDCEDSDFVGSSIEPIATGLISSRSATSEVPDTTAIAAAVRKRLYSKGISQRLFARHVLALSQGTTSDLLCRPKPWRRLAGRARQSYNRMLTWLTDPAGLDTLARAARSTNS